MKRWNGLKSRRKNKDKGADKEPGWKEVENQVLVTDAATQTEEEKEERDNNKGKLPDCLDCQGWKSCV